MSTRNRTTSTRTRRVGTGRVDTETPRSRRRAHEGQLRLVSTTERPDWRLDARTRRIGRRGVAEARAILARANPPEPFAPESLAG